MFGKNGPLDIVGGANWRAFERIEVQNPLFSDWHSTFFGSASTR